MASGRHQRPPVADGETSTRIMRAAAHLFARQGIDAVKISEINRLAAQRNESAVHYHFGSRMNLVTAILEENELIAARVRSPGETRPTTPSELVVSLVRRLAIGLDTPEGRDWLQIVSQLLHRGPVLVADSSVSNRLASVVAMLVELTPELPADVVERRGRVIVRFVTDEFADRARRIDGPNEGGELTDEAEFLDELARMATAILLIPPSA